MSLAAIDMSMLFEVVATDLPISTQEAPWSWLKQYVSQVSAAKHVPPAVISQQMRFLPSQRYFFVRVFSRAVVGWIVKCEMAAGALRVSAIKLSPA